MKTWKLVAVVLTLTTAGARAGWDNNGWDNNGWDNNGWDNNGWDNNGWDNNGWDNNGWHGTADGAENAFLGDPSLGDKWLNNPFTSAFWMANDDMRVQLQNPRTAQFIKYAFAAACPRGATFDVTEGSWYPYATFHFQGALNGGQTSKWCSPAASDATGRKIAGYCDDQCLQTISGILAGSQNRYRIHNPVSFRGGAGALTTMEKEIPGYNFVMGSNLSLLSISNPYGTADYGNNNSAWRLGLSFYCSAGTTVQVDTCSPVATFDTELRVCDNLHGCDNPYLPNGSFESGSAYWNTKNVTSYPASATWGWTYYPTDGSAMAQIGSGSPTNGDSSISQDFNLPTNGGAMLSFDYLISCPDSVTYDWSTIELDMVGLTGATTPIYKSSPTCSNTGAWQQFNYDLSGYGGKIRLTIVSHDDNYAGDPTFTLVDNVKLGLKFNNAASGQWANYITIAPKAPLGFNDDYCGLQSQITLTCSSSGVRNVMWRPYTSTTVVGPTDMASHIHVAQVSSTGTLISPAPEDVVFPAREAAFFGHLGIGSKWAHPSYQNCPTRVRTFGIRGLPLTGCTAASLSAGTCTSCTNTFKVDEPRNPALYISTDNGWTAGQDYFHYRFCSSNAGEGCVARYLGTAGTGGSNVYDSASNPIPGRCYYTSASTDPSTGKPDNDFGACWDGTQWQKNVITTFLPSYCSAFPAGGSVLSYQPTSYDGSLAIWSTVAAPCGNVNSKR